MEAAPTARAESDATQALEKIPARMCALVKAESRPGAELIEVSTPSLGARDVLIKVRAASICGTDLHIFAWDEWAQGRIHPPLVFGHEFAGDVVAIGSDVTKI